MMKVVLEVENNFFNEIDESYSLSVSKPSGIVTKETIVFSFALEMLDKIGAIAVPTVLARFAIIIMVEYLSSRDLISSNTLSTKPLMRQTVGLIQGLQSTYTEF